jgi:hypothetical protein
MKRSTYSCFLAAGFCLMGCRGNLAPFQPASTMPARGFAVGVEGSGVGALSDEGDELEGTFSVTGRYAVTDRIEIGARVGTTRPEIMAKFRLDQGKPGSTAISFAPSVGAFVVTATGIVGVNSYGQLPILVGIPVGRHEFVFSGALHFGHAVDIETNVWGFVLSPGASLGFVAQPAPWLSILPNFALALPLLQAGPSGVGTTDTVTYQLGVAIFGGRLHQVKN